MGIKLNLTAPETLQGPCTHLPCAWANLAVLVALPRPQWFAFRRMPVGDLGLLLSGLQVDLGAGGGLSLPNYILVLMVCCPGVFVYHLVPLGVFMWRV